MVDFSDTASTDWADVGARKDPHLPDDPNVLHQLPDGSPLFGPLPPVGTVVRETRSQREYFDQLLANGTPLAIAVRMARAWTGDAKRGRTKRLRDGKRSETRKDRGGFVGFYRAPSTAKAADTGRWPHQRTRRELIAEDHQAMHDRHGTL